MSRDVTSTTRKASCRRATKRRKWKAVSEKNESFLPHSRRRNLLARQNRDETRIKHLTEAVIDRRGILCRTHNDYLQKLREYNFVDEQYGQRLRRLLAYHDEAQTILNQSWQKLLEAIANYDQAEENTRGAMKRMIHAIDLQRCYDEIRRTGVR